MHRVALTVTTTCFASLALAGVAAADVISINYFHTNDNSPLAASDVAGVVPVDNWNNINVVAGSDQAVPGDNIVSNIPLVDDSGSIVVGTLAGYRAGDKANRTTDPPNPADGPNYALMSSTFYGNKSGGDGGKNEYVEVLNLSADYTSPGYDLYLYTGATSENGEGNFLIDFGADGSTDLTTLTADNGTPAYNGNFNQVQVDTGSNEDQGHYIKVEGLTASSFRAVINQTSGAEFGISGLQIVAIPEPASLSLLAAGGLCLIGRRRR